MKLSRHGGEIRAKKVPQKILKKITGNLVSIIYLKNSDHRLSSKYDLKIINESILSILKNKI